MSNSRPNSPDALKNIKTKNIIDEFKVKASILLKSLRSTEMIRVKEAALRFKKHPSFSELSISEIIKNKEEIQRKHALDVIALENGQNSWRELQVSFKEQGAGFISKDQQTTNRDVDPLYISTGRLHLWFANYEEAKNAHHKDGGFLLVHRNHYFVCGPEYIKDLGLDPEDPDWTLIGRDWANPGDSLALSRLRAKLKSARNQKKNK